VLESVQYPNGASTATVYSYDSMYRMLSAAAGTGAAGGNITKITRGKTVAEYTYDSCLGVCGG